MNSGTGFPKKKRKKERKRKETVNSSVQEHEVVAFPTPKIMWPKPRSLNIWERFRLAYKLLVHTGYKEQHCF